MVTDEEEAAAAEEEERFKVNLVNARRLPRDLYESEEAVAARQHLARAAAAAAEKKAEEQRRRLLAQERSQAARSSSSGRGVGGAVSLHRSPARKSSPAVSLVPPPPGLAAIATPQGRGRWGEDSEGEEAAAHAAAAAAQQQYARLPSAGGHAWTPAAARAAAGLGFLQPTFSNPQQQHHGSAGRSPLGRGAVGGVGVGPRPDTPVLEGAGDSGHLPGAPLVPPGGPLEVAVGHATTAAAAGGGGAAAAMAAVSGSRGGGAVSGGSQGSRYLDSPSHHTQGGLGGPSWGSKDVSRAFWTKEVRPGPEAEAELRGV
jgi:hypothetical protein